MARELDIDDANEVTPFTRMGGLGRGGDSNGGERDLKDFSGRNQAMAQMEQSRREDRGRVRDDELELVSDMHPSEMLERYAGRDVAQVYT